jgi:hypothetical protein
MSHRIGEDSFAAKFNINLKELAEEFAKKSPHWRKISNANEECD